MKRGIAIKSISREIDSRSKIKRGGSRRLSKDEFRCRVLLEMHIRRFMKSACIA